MQCRICFEEGDALTLLTPCQCRGTASYIHRTCLDQYIRYYPDRICRVCRDHFPRYVSTYELRIGALAVGALITLLLISSARLLVKVALFASLSALSFYFVRRNLFTTTPLVFLSILALLFLPGGNPSAVYLWFIILGGIAFVYTLGQHLPAMLLLRILVTAMTAAYTGFFVVLAYVTLDPSAFVVFLSVLYLSWYAWLHDTPLRLRYI